MTSVESVSKAMDPHRITEGTPQEETTPRSSRRGARWRDLRLVFEALAVAYLIVTFGITTVGVVGSSMEPTLTGGSRAGNLLRAALTGDRVFVPKYETWLRRAGVLGQYQRGDIVILREPANAPHALVQGRRNLIIKRVIGVPGDLVRIEAGQVYVNGAPIDQGFITRAGSVRVQPVDFPKVVVSHGEITAMVMGFNDALSRASTPILPWHGSDHDAVPVVDERVQLYYASVLDAISVPDGTPDGVPVVLDFSVPDGTYFVMGDNRSFGGSEDSRFFGPVDAMAITGRATAVIWPLWRDGGWNPRLSSVL